MKILFTSVGRRVELVQAFRLAAEKLGVDLRIYGADVTDTAPAVYFCDEWVKVPCISDVDYIPRILRVCCDKHIDALIPTIDTDLLLLAKMKGRFAQVGTKAIISNPDKVSLCRDKRLTADYFHSLCLASPTPVDDYKKYSGGYPAFIKPKDGSSSIFAYKVSNEEELTSYSQQVPDYIVQPFIEGTEYTVDVFCDFNGEPIYITPRIRLATRSGEVLKTEINQKQEIIEDIKILLADFKPCGPLTVQLIRKENVNYFIEINPRYGGGAPLSIKAGADSPMALLKLLQGEELKYIQNAAIEGAIYSRFDQNIRIK